MLDGGFFSRAHAAEGKMRTYLLTAFTRHMADEWDKANARKRGGGIEKLSLDFDEGERRYLLEPAASETHDLAFERAWAAQIIDSAGGRLEQECVQTGKGELFARIAPLIIGGGESASYEELSGPCGMSVEALRQVVRRLRLRFRELLRESVADTLEAPSDADIDGELHALRAALAS
jgi:RNA polymerase sigma-70 factor (ECF subfamily)